MIYRDIVVISYINIQMLDKAPRNLVEPLIKSYLNRS